MSLIILASISTGVAVGWSVGQAGLDSAVLAAVLPVIITSIAGGAGAVVLKIMKRRNSTQDSHEYRRLVVGASAVVIAFSIAYLAASIVGDDMKDRANLAIEQQGINLATELATERYKYLIRCTQQLKRLNEIRRMAEEEARNSNLDLALEPLTADQVCIALPLGALDEGPLVLFANSKGFATLSPDTETEHYTFLESCSIEQSIMNRGRKTDAKVEIGEVCPALGYR